MKLLWVIFGAILVVIASVVIEIFVVQWLWNWLVPTFWAKAPILTFGQTFSVLVLLNIIGGVLFKKAK